MHGGYRDTREVVKKKATNFNTRRPLHGPAGAAAARAPAVGGVYNCFFSVLKFCLLYYKKRRALPSETKKFSMVSTSMRNFSCLCPCSVPFNLRNMFHLIPYASRLTTMCSG